MHPIPMLRYAAAVALLACVPLAAAYADSLAAPPPDLSAWLISLIASYPWAGYAIVAGVLLPQLMALLPQPQPGTPMAALRRMLDILAGNYANASNAALRTPGPAMAAVLAAPGPQAVLTVSHLIEAFAAGHELGQKTAVEPLGPFTLGTAAGFAPGTQAQPANAPPAQPATGPVATTLGAIGAVMLLLGLSACATTPATPGGAPTAAATSTATTTTARPAASVAQVTLITVRTAYQAALAAETLWLETKCPTATPKCAVTAQQLRRARLAAMAAMLAVETAANGGTDAASLLADAMAAALAFQAAVDAAKGGV